MSSPESPLQTEEPALETPSAVPHEAGLVASPVRLRSSRFGELEEHELIRLLDTIEDERARGRFRESIYISLFIWIAIAWFVFYGPRLLWHQRLINPSEVLKQRELTQLIAPELRTPVIKVPRVAPKLDNKTMERLRREEPTRPSPLPDAPKPQPATSQPASASPPPTPAPQPHAPVANVPDAPHPQPATKPNFNQSPQSAGDVINNALHDAAKNGRSGASGSPVARRSSPLNIGGVDVLSDTQGVDFDPYLRRIISDVYRNWLPLIPEEARPPLYKEGETLIRFTILPDGTVGAMHLEDSTHDDAINRSCWGSITGEGQFPPLPSQFHGPNLELRFHYTLNKKVE